MKLSELGGSSRQAGPGKLIVNKVGAGRCCQSQGNVARPGGDH